MSDLTAYQYYGLVGQGVSQFTSSAINGFAGVAQSEINEGAYGLSAEGQDLQAEQVLINAEASANARMENYNQTEAANAALIAAMGKSSDNNIISDENLAAANKDTSLMRRKGRVANISARSGASAARSAATQSKIAGKAAMINSVFGMIQGGAKIAGTVGMLGGGKDKGKDKDKGKGE